MVADRTPLELFVQNLALRTELSSDDCASIFALPYTVCTLEPSTYLSRVGDLHDLCAVLVSGLACRHKMTGEGARQIVAVHIAGEALNLQSLFLDEADHSVKALTLCDVALISRNAIRAVMLARPRVAHAIMVNIAVEASIAREWIMNIGRRDARARIAHLLCEFAIRLDAQGLGERQRYILPMTQEQIGDATGLTSIHVNRMLKSLRSEGLLTKRGRIIDLHDWQVLQSAVEFTGRYLHLPEGV